MRLVLRDVSIPALESACVYSFLVLHNLDSLQRTQCSEADRSARKPGYERSWIESVVDEVADPAKCRGGKKIVSDLAVRVDSMGKQRVYLSVENKQLKQQLARMQQEKFVKERSLVRGNEVEAFFDRVWRLTYGSKGRTLFRCESHCQTDVPHQIQHLQECDSQMKYILRCHWLGAIQLLEILLSPYQIHTKARKPTKFLTALIRCAKAIFVENMEKQVYPNPMFPKLGSYTL
ncbi:hypothetical protein Tco_0985557 [Tanacetum coccineum]